MSFPRYDEADLPSGGIAEDIDSINAMLAQEGMPDDTPEDSFLEEAFEDLSDPFGSLDD